MSGQVVQALVDNLLVPVLTALAAAIVGLIGWLGAAAKRALDATTTKAQADTYARDIAALVGLMQRRAMAEVSNTATPTPKPEDLVAYAERVKGDLLAKMSLSPEGLATMAQAAIATAQVATAPPVVVAPADVLVGGGDLAVALHRSVPPGG